MKVGNDRRQGRGNGGFNQELFLGNKKQKMRKDRREGAVWWKQETDIPSEPMQSILPSWLGKIKIEIVLYIIFTKKKTVGFGSNQQSG